MESKYAGMSPYNYSFNNPVMWNDLSGADPDKPPIEASKKLMGNPKPVDENVLEYINPDGSFTGEQANIPLDGVTVTGSYSGWSKFKAGLRGFAKGVVIAAAVVTVIAITGGAGAVVWATAMTYAATGMGIAVTAKTGYELISGKEAFTGRELGTLEKWEMGGELIGGIVGGGRMMGGKKGPRSSQTPMPDVPIPESRSRWTSSATEPSTFSEPTSTGVPKFTESISSGTTKFAESIRTSEVESATTTLLRMEAENPGSHFVSRHGANTTLQEQYVRATTGFTPDGFQGRRVNSTRFLSEMDQLEAANIATQHFQQTGESSFSFDMGRVIGEGYMKGGGNRVEATQVQAVFRNNKLYTMYPKP